VEAVDAHFREPQPAADRRLLRTVHVRLRSSPVGAGDDGHPTARPRSLITGKTMDKIVWGPNWEEILGGEFEKRSKDRNFDDIQKDIYGEFENTFMMYLPRLCEHCLNPACVASCPSGSIYKREEDGIVLIDQDKCRGWRMCVSGCPYKKIYYNWQSGKAEKCTFCYPRIEAGQPRCARRPVWAASAISVYCSTMPTESRKPRVSNTIVTCIGRSWTFSSIRMIRV
jgi:nitrate reductase beta subunit